MTYRILVTGSRNWTDEDEIQRVLLDAAGGRQDVTLVHGDCPTGADQIAAGLAREFEWTVEPHPADWDLYGKAAGPRRNSEMVRLGADVCCAFPLGDSRGTHDCAGKAQAAGITVHYGGTTANL